MNAALAQVRNGFKRWSGPSRRPDRKGWHARWYQPSTRRSAWISLRTREYDLAYKRMRELEAADGYTPVTLGQVAQAWIRDLEVRVTQRTLENMRSCIARWPESWLANDVRILTATEVRDWLETHRQTHAPRSTNRERAHLSWLLGWAEKQGYIDLNPVRLTSRYHVEKRPPRALSPAEQERLHAALREEQPVVQALYVLALETGLRRRTLIELEWGHVDLESGWLHIPGALLKSRRPYSCPMSHLALSALRHHYDTTTGGRSFSPGARVFPVDPRRVGETFQRLCAAAGIEGAVFHDLRRTFITNCRRRGTPIEVTARLSDHHDIRTLIEIYRAVDDEELLHAVGRPPPQ